MQTDFKTDKATLVSALYNYSPNHILGGRGWGFDHYKSPLLNILKLDCPVIFYSDKTMTEQLEPFLSNFASSDYKIIEFDLMQASFSEKVIAFKKSQYSYDENNVLKQPHSIPYTALDRNHHICLQKMSWLMSVANLNMFETDFFYWIDAGIAHHGIFPETFGGMERLTACEYKKDKYYPENPNSIFQPTFIKNLNKICKKFFCMHHQEHPVSASINKLLNCSVAKYIIAGMFGGPKSSIEPIHDIFYQILDKVLDNNILCLEEPILSTVAGLHDDLLQTYSFTHWYHDIKGDPCYGNLTNNEKCFYKIFKKIKEEKFDEL